MQSLSRFAFQARWDTYVVQLEIALFDVASCVENTLRCIYIEDEAELGARGCLTLEAVDKIFS